jgi:hypothetical protein
MTTSNIAFLDERPEFHVYEDRGDYGADPEAHAAHLYEAQGQIGDALNLAGLLLASLEDQGDARAMQVSTAVTVIEEKLKNAYNRLDEHEARHTKLFLAYAELRDKAEGIE